MQCCVGACPSIFGNETDNYYIIGKVVDAKSLGLEKKVGKDEMLIAVPKGIIDGMRRDDRNKE
jgi:hypothetical protein